jgi:hypothetical protein
LLRQRKNVINNTAAANVQLFTIASTTALSQTATEKEVAKLTGTNAKGEVTVIVISR